MEHESNRTGDLQLIYQHDVEFTRSAAGAEGFSGYALRFYDPKDPGTEYVINDSLRERISPEALRSTPLDDVELWFEHSNTMCMGEVNTQTLFLTPDTKGLRFFAPYDAADPDHIRAKAKIAKKRVNGASIRFKGDFKMHKEGNTWIRTITRLTAIREFSLVKNPAYPSCMVETRSKEVSDLDRREQIIARTKFLLEKRK
jgi:HK97 family phage prohead protease